MSGYRSLFRQWPRLRSLPFGLAWVVAATLGAGQLPVLVTAASAATPSAFDDQTQQQLRKDECLLSNMLRLGGPMMKQVARAGLDGDAAALHSAANPYYWNDSPLDVAYETDHKAELAKLDQLEVFDQNRAKVNGTLSLGTLETPSSIPFGPADPWNAINPEVADPFDTVGLSKWVAQNFWTSEDTFYDDPTPLASKDSVTALTTLGARYQDVRAGAADVLVHNCSNLAADEGINGAHTLADHVNITAADAVAKATASTPTGVWSSQALAQQAVDTAVARYAKSNAKTIEAWFKRYGKNPTMENSTLELPLQKLPSATSLGKVYYQDGRVAAAGNTYKVVLKRVPKHPQGFVVYTSYPLP